MSTEADRAKAKAKAKAAEDGVVNPQGAAISGFAVAYLAFVPVTTYLARTNALSAVVDGVARFIPGYTPTTGRIIPALSALYIFATFGASGAASAAGQAMSRSEGLDNDHPRKFINDMEGLPLRMRSAHYGLLENFPAFAVAAALAQIIAPNNREVVNLLGFHVIAKVFVYYPCYLANIAPPRTLAHLTSIAATIGVCWKLATGAS